MNQKNKFSIITLVAISIMAVGIFSITTTVDNAEPQKNTGGSMMVSNSYTTIDIDEMKEISKDIVKGEIINKYNIIQYRDSHGNYVAKDSGLVAETQPYIVYELHPEQSVKAKDQSKKLYSFKVLGGDLNGMHVYTEIPEFEVGDKVIVLLDNALDGKNQELVSGEFGIFKLKDGKAKNSEKEFSEKVLLKQLEN